MFLVAFEALMKSFTLPLTNLHHSLPQPLSIARRHVSTPELDIENGDRTPPITALLNNSKYISYGSTLLFQPPILRVASTFSFRELKLPKTSLPTLFPVFS